MARRAADVVGATVLLVLLFPALCVGAAAVLIGSGRPVFFGHARLGKDGRVFPCWKLRTMRTRAEHELHREPTLHRDYVANGYKLPNGKDPRVTKVGVWLRRTYADEIPQLFNVLAGTMSLVGPRPIVPDELREYGPEGDELLSTRPGIVGAWTALGRRRPDYPERARIELSYVRHRSALRDFTILLRTVPVVLRGQGGD
ncbi:MAG: sugar transferase [Gemmatimonadetes bacterium]|nr:sugar transferase [Gemmatimonadota bacterium]